MTSILEVISSASGIALAAYLVAVIYHFILFLKRRQRYMLALLEEIKAKEEKLKD